VTVYLESFWTSHRCMAVNAPLFQLELEPPLSKMGQCDSECIRLSPIIMLLEHLMRYAHNSSHIWIAFLWAVWEPEAQSSAIVYRPIDLCLSRPSLNAFDSCAKLFANCSPHDYSLERRTQDLGKRFIKMSGEGNSS